MLELLVAYVSVAPLSVVPLSVAVPPTRMLVGLTLAVTVGFFLFTVSVAVAEFALYKSVAAAFAVIVAVPAPAIVTVLPLTVATLEGLMLYVTAPTALALSVNVPSPYVFVTLLNPEIVCVPLFTVTVNVCSFARYPVLAAFVTLMMNVPQAVTVSVTLFPLTPTVPVPVPPVFVAEIAPVPLPPPTARENANPSYVFVTVDACPSSVRSSCSTAACVYVTTIDFPLMDFVKVPPENAVVSSLTCPKSVELKLPCVVRIVHVAELPELNDDPGVSFTLKSELIAHPPEFMVVRLSLAFCPVVPTSTLMVVDAWMFITPTLTAPLKSMVVPAVAFVNARFVTVPADVSASVPPFRTSPCLGAFFVMVVSVSVPAPVLYISGAATFGFQFAIVMFPAPPTVVDTVFENVPERFREPDDTSNDPAISWLYTSPLNVLFPDELKIAPWLL